MAVSDFRIWSKLSLVETTCPLLYPTLLICMIDYCRSKTQIIGFSLFFSICKPCLIGVSVGACQNRNLYLTAISSQLFKFWNLNLIRCVFLVLLGLCHKLKCWLTSTNILSILFCCQVTSRIRTFQTLSVLLAFFLNEKLFQCTSDWAPKLKTLICFGMFTML